MVVATPVAVELAFAHRGAPVSHVGTAPALCDPSGCSTLIVWGGGGKVTYLAPKRGKDFVVVLFPTAAAARRIGSVERSAGIGTATKRSTLLVYLKSSTRVAKLRAALSALH